MTRRLHATLLTVLLVSGGIVAAFGDGPEPRSAPSFVDVAQAAGIVSRNVSGSEHKAHIVETTGAGACFLDHDLDGDLDLYLVNGATLETAGPGNPATNALYRNNGDGTFTDVTSAAGVGDRGWGGGCAVADYDGDGDPDIHVSNNGANVLYRNRGDGTFEDVTQRSGVGDARWSTSATFFDADLDGDLDLYVTNYVDFDRDAIATERPACHWKGARVMCGPHGFAGQSDVFYRNQGDGVFVDATTEAGFGGYARFGLGVVAGDVDGDGDPDVWVANDSQANLLFLNDGAGRFVERGLLAGVALSGDGREQAGMGVDIGDYDGDGDGDLFVTNFSDDYHTLYRNDGNGLFTDVSLAAGLASTRASLG